MSVTSSDDHPTPAMRAARAISEHFFGDSASEIGVKRVLEMIERQAAPSELLKRLEAANRLIELLHEYGEVKFGADEWWSGSAHTVLDRSPAEVEEILGAETRVPEGLVTEKVGEPNFGCPFCKSGEIEEMVLTHCLVEKWSAQGEPEAYGPTHVPGRTDSDVRRFRYWCRKCEDMFMKPARI